MIAAWPLIGQPSVDEQLYLGPNRVIDGRIDADRYWRIIAEHQTNQP